MRGSWLWSGGLFVSASLIAASPAVADTAVRKVIPSVAAPDTSIEIVVGCGGPCPPRLPVSLVPASQAPRPHPCRVNGVDAVCSAHANAPPSSHPFIFLGQANETGAESGRYVLRTRVPGVRPGAYAFAVYLDARDNSTGGSLIVNADSPGTLLRVSAERESSNGSGTDTVWWIAGAAVLIAVVAGAVVVRRRESR